MEGITRKKKKGQENEKGYEKREQKVRAGKGEAMGNRWEMKGKREG